MLRSCPDCGGVVSDTANACPVCGFNMAQRREEELSESRYRRLTYRAAYDELMKSGDEGAKKTAEILKKIGMF